VKFISRQRGSIMISDEYSTLLGMFVSFLKNSINTITSLSSSSIGTSVDMREIESSDNSIVV
jgi:hypothetical protein